MSKIKSFFKKHSKKIAVSAVACMTAVIGCFSSFAAEAGQAASSSDLQSSFSTAISSVQSDILGYLGLALPVGLAIFGAVIATKKGISFVRGLIGR
ncbi:hypothetical protein [uncultured Ruminococcus sp.]|uniref:hypothetical protein n=1 Tax=uncultured Ruminococcus sp. TaxID=165186 RepID=UPI0025EE0A03|nr:hypothetical protein [uncultured Ruminococcus sp.]